MAKKVKTPSYIKKEAQKKHYCPIHDEICKCVMVMPGRKIKFNCPKEHQLNKKEMIIK